MFRNLNTDKISSETLVAQKLFYPGANAEIMLKKLKADIGSLKMTPDLIYVMCGTNNVDRIYYGSGNLNDAAEHVNELLLFLKVTFPNAKLNVINILPRSIKGKNDVVIELNKLIRDFCITSDINYMKTDHLFNYKDGNRKNRFFMAPSEHIPDNCHLNWEGTIRLGKFIKFWTYKHLS